MIKTVLMIISGIILRIILNRYYFGLLFSFNCAVNLCSHSYHLDTYLFTQHLMSINSAVVQHKIMDNVLQHKTILILSTVGP